MRAIVKRSQDSIITEQTVLIAVSVHESCSTAAGSGRRCESTPHLIYFHMMMTTMI